MAPAPSLLPGPSSPDTFLHRPSFVRTHSPLILALFVSLLLHTLFTNNPLLPSSLHDSTAPVSFASIPAILSAARLTSSPGTPVEALLRPGKGSLAQQQAEEEEGKTAIPPSPLYPFRYSTSACAPAIVRLAPSFSSHPAHSRTVLALYQARAGSLCDVTAAPFAIPVSVARVLGTGHAETDIVGRGSLVEAGEEQSGSSVDHTDDAIVNTEEVDYVRAGDSVYTMDGEEYLFKMDVNSWMAVATLPGDVPGVDPSMGYQARVRHGFTEDIHDDKAHRTRHYHSTSSIYQNDLTFFSADTVTSLPTKKFRIAPQTVMGTGGNSDIPRKRAPGRAIASASVKITPQHIAHHNGDASKTKDSLPFLFKSGQLVSKRSFRFGTISIHAKIPLFRGAHPYIQLRPSSDEQFSTMTQRSFKDPKQESGSDKKTSVEGFEDEDEDEKEGMLDGSQEDILLDSYAKKGVCKIDSTKGGRTMSKKDWNLGVLSCAGFSTKSPFGGEIDILRMFTDPSQSFAKRTRSPFCGTTEDSGQKTFNKEAAESESGNSRVYSLPALHYAFPAWKSGVDSTFLSLFNIDYDIATENIRWYFANADKSSIPEDIGSDLTFIPSYISAYALQRAFQKEEERRKAQYEGSSKQVPYPMRYMDVDNMVFDGGYYRGTVTRDGIGSDPLLAIKRPPADVNGDGQGRARDAHLEGSEDSEQPYADAENDTHGYKDTDLYEDEVHVYTLKWMPTYIEWYYDGELVMRQEHRTTSDHRVKDQKNDKKGGSHDHHSKKYMPNPVPRGEMRLVIGLAVGSNTDWRYVPGDGDDFHTSEKYVGRSRRDTEHDLPDFEEDNETPYTPSNHQSPWDSTVKAILEEKAKDNQEWNIFSKASSGPKRPSPRELYENQLWDSLTRTEDPSLYVLKVEYDPADAQELHQHESSDPSYEHKGLKKAYPVWDGYIYWEQQLFYHNLAYTGDKKPYVNFGSVIVDMLKKNYQSEYIRDALHGSQLSDSSKVKMSATVAFLHHIYIHERLLWAMRNANRQDTRSFEGRSLGDTSAPKQYGRYLGCSPTADSLIRGENCDRVYGTSCPSDVNMNQMMDALADEQAAQSAIDEQPSYIGEILDNINRQKNIQQTGFPSSYAPHVSENDKEQKSDALSGVQEAVLNKLIQEVEAAIRDQNAFALTNSTDRANQSKSNASMDGAAESQDRGQDRVGLKDTPAHAVLDHSNYNGPQVKTDFVRIANYETPLKTDHEMHADQRPIARRSPTRPDVISSYDRNAQLLGSGQGYLRAMGMQDYLAGKDELQRLGNLPDVDLMTGTGDYQKNIEKGIVNANNKGTTTHLPEEFGSISHNNYVEKLWGNDIPQDIFVSERGRDDNSRLHQGQGRISNNNAGGGLDPISQLITAYFENALNIKGEKLWASRLSKYESTFVEIYGKCRHTSRGFDIWITQHCIQHSIVNTLKLVVNSNPLCYVLQFSP
eukprot:Nk52_evm2s484 gene=Nk52_evmTU2s484